MDVSDPIWVAVVDDAVLRRHRGRNEITAGPRVLELMYIRDAVVTIGAMGCQKGNAKVVADEGGDYVLQLKGNQGGLRDETTSLFDQCLRGDCLGIEYTTATTINKGHGRIEQRTLVGFERLLPRYGRCRNRRSTFL